MLSAQYDKIHMGKAESNALQNLLRGEQGFAWWYVDLLDAQGDGLVLVWSFGLPFLAGSRDARSPRLRPAVCVALYRGGRPAYYSLNEYPPEEAVLEGSGGTARIGKSHFDVREVGGAVELVARLNEPLVGGSGLTGSLHLSGPALDLPSGGSDMAHVWMPRVFQARARAELRVDAHSWQLDGSAYFDSNFSAVPLHEQGIASWNWGRIHLAGDEWGERTVVYYQVQSEDGPATLAVLEQTCAGDWRRREAEIALQEQRRGRYGLKSSRRLRLLFDDEEIRLSLGTPVDDGPFYQRFILVAESDSGALGRGFAETLYPASLDVPWQRPFIRMRTQRVGDQNSAWLPLFSGVPEERLRRLLQCWRAA